MLMHRRALPFLNLLRLSFVILRGILCFSSDSRSLIIKSDLSFPVRLLSGEESEKFVVIYVK
jgi:hypothetical protein